ncbi:Hypothetical protein Minf_0742 [Methylacidiphilum infernorum V4]|uniref:Uncharacterized protein n=1 Tax=Methylacidiphilum infernorum (isolate V4) TaxID=481448 RepID=B3E0P3_METI4|nr:Hypothetical protein Minf_0742 [Methylacidiphilum infernorum V4]
MRWLAEKTSLLGNTAAAFFKGFFHAMEFPRIQDELENQES